MLLSIGGESKPTEWGFKDEEAAAQGSRKIWQMFGPPSNASDIVRSFGVAVDGFDLDFENPQQFESGHFLVFSQELRTLTKNDSTGKRNFYLSAAPQCPFELDIPLTERIEFDMWFVQF